MSPVAVLDGPLGLEAFHKVNGITLNDLTAIPRIRLDRIPGFYALPDADDNRSPNQGRIGETPYPSVMRGKTIVYEGRVQGRTLQEARATAAAFRAAVSERNAEVLVSVEPHATYGAISYFYTARVTGFNMDEEAKYDLTSVPSPYQFDFTWTLRMSDPRFYVGGAELVSGGANGATVVIPNDGLAPTEPVIAVAGPIADGLVVERLNNPDARKITLDNVGLAAGQTLRLDFSRRLIYRISDGADFSGKEVFAETNWWDETIRGLERGNTSVKVTGGGAWTVTYRLASF